MTGPPLPTNPILRVTGTVRSTTPCASAVPKPPPAPPQELPDRSEAQNSELICSPGVKPVPCTATVVRYGRFVRGVTVTTGSGGGGTEVSKAIDAEACSEIGSFSPYPYAATSHAAGAQSTIDEVIGSPGSGNVYSRTSRLTATEAVNAPEASAWRSARYSPQKPVWSVPHSLTDTCEFGSKLAPRTSTCWSWRRPVCGVTVIDGGGGTGWFGSNVIGAVAT